ncbi:MAG: polyribonucleotide nucleotidyltransferase [Candidatus Omnitrophica bacterium]|nr:polyribonucleotide nucleotidyltransferase [Candidatus Omnitrophota bacterium]MDD5436892.1 polyribonucleotide nucleotidyltransferase [Candidatus Omnitrophota bacterium]
MAKKFEAKLGENTITIETGRMAKQADGAVAIQLGGTVVLSTAVCSKQARQDIDFFPLTCEYQEKTYAAGKIPGGFFKREGRPSEKEILTARLTDRPIRPLFPKGFINEVQLVSMVLSSDGENDSDVLAMVGASTALTISDIPFNGPIGAVRVGRIDGKFVINPTFQQLATSDLDMVVAGTRSAVIMIESGSNELGEDVIFDAVKFAHREMQPLIDIQEKMAKECGSKKRDIELHIISDELIKKVKELSEAKLAEINKLNTKEQREDAMDALAGELKEKLATEESGYSEKDVKNALNEVEEENVRKFIVEKKKRVDGRNFDEIRQITCEVGVLPRTHGSGLFTRGQTQSLSVTTLGTSADEQTIDALEGETQKSFMLHYNFPPFSVGEARPIRGPGRREIGHGALAERALKAVMPNKDKFPYTVRVVSDILESNGSSSMATVCASSLSLMDAGVPITKPVSGIAIGLIKEKDHFIILTDIGGVEDHYGDMDFKVAGTKDGITAVQMDLKVEGINEDILREALAVGKKSRLFILDKMAQAIAGPKGAISAYAPQIVSFKINQSKIGEVIGPGGKNIKKIIQDYGVTVDISDDGTVQVASHDQAAIEQAVNVIKGITEEPEIGRIYKGKVKRIMAFGAFCEILPGKEGLVHVSELANKFVKTVEDVVKIGDEIMVKVIEVDDQGRVNLSKRQADPDWTPEMAEKAEKEKRDRPPRRKRE